MAYGFEQKMAKNDETVELYLNERMHFEAWITIINHWESDWDKLEAKLDQEFYKKTTPLTDDEIESLQCEFYDMRS